MGGGGKDNMKTKIVYTIVTDESDLYLEQLLVSLVSLKHHSPSAHIVIVTDDASKSTMTGNRAKVLEYINELIVPETPKDFSKVMLSRYLKTTLRQHITGDFLYIDTDTVIASPLDEIDEIASSGVQLAGVREMNSPLERIQDGLSKHYRRRGYNFTVNTKTDRTFINGGVMFASDTPEVHDFYSAWYNNWLEMSAQAKYYLDQVPLAVTSRTFPSLVQLLDDGWNCLVTSSGGGGFSCINRAKVIHCQVDNFEKKTSPFIFCTQDVFKRIKSECGIPEDVLPFIFDPRSAFLPYTQPITENEYTKCAPFRAMLAFYPKSFALFRFVARVWMFIPNQIKRFCKKK